MSGADQLAEVQRVQASRNRVLVLSMARAEGEIDSVGPHAGVLPFMLHCTDCQQC